MRAGRALCDHRSRRAPRGDGKDAGHDSDGDTEQGHTEVRPAQDRHHATGDAERREHDWHCWVRGSVHVSLQMSGGDGDGEIDQTARPNPGGGLVAQLFGEQEGHVVAVLDAEAARIDAQ